MNGIGAYEPEVFRQRAVAALAEAVTGRLSPVVGPLAGAADAQAALESRTAVAKTLLRQLNAAIHRIALARARCHPGARALLERRGQDKHETRKASFRVLKRHLSDAVYRALNADAWRLDTPGQHAA